MALTNSAEAQLYDHVHQLLRAHETLLSDARRNRPFLRALQKQVRAESHVLDIGSGTGVWALTAARLGARRVVAVESEPLLIEVIRELARANGVAERLEAIHGDSRSLALPREFDLVVTETIGHVGFDEQIAAIAMDARVRFLKPGGMLIPTSISLHAAGVQLKSAPKTLPVGVPLNYGYFESLMCHSPLPASRQVPFRCVTPPRRLIETDLMAISTPPDLSNLTARWPASEVSASVDGFVVWCEVLLTKSVRLSTLQANSWSPMIYRIRPFADKAGDLEFKLTLGSETSHWSVAQSVANRTETQSYSPAQAAAELVARARTGVGVFSHHQRLVLMPRGADGSHAPPS